MGQQILRFHGGKDEIGRGFGQANIIHFIDLHHIHKTSEMLMRRSKEIITNRVDSDCLFLTQRSPLSQAILKCREWIISALLRSWRYRIPVRLVGECSGELAGLRKGCEVGHLHTCGACDKNDSKSTNWSSGSYPGEIINQLKGMISIMMDLTNFFAVPDWAAGLARSALSMSTSVKMMSPTTRSLSAVEVLDADMVC